MVKHKFIAFTLNASITPNRVTRRETLITSVGALFSLSLTHPRAAIALKPGAPSKEKLLKRAHEDLTPEEKEQEKERIAEERKARLERQKELQAEAERRRLGLEPTTQQADLEANLRASYYYPAARKRYLPRVKRALDLLPVTDNLVTAGDWSEASALATGALADAVLPMQLYASSLAGQGLSLAPRFVQRMDDAASTYNEACTKLQKACKKRDSTIARENVKTMLAAVQRYRVEGRLESDDFGIGEVPLDTRVGSGFSNSNPALYNRNIKSILNE